MKLIIGWIIIITTLVCFKECSVTAESIDHEDQIKPHRMTYEREWHDVIDNSSLLFDIASFENSIGVGYIEGKWYPYPSLEGGNDTIAYGHKIQDYEKQKFKNGIGEIQAYRLLIKDIEKAVRTINIDPIVWNELSWKQKYLLIDFQFNLGNVVRIFPKFTAAVLENNKTHMLQQYKRYYKDPDGNKWELKDRNKRIRKFIINNF